MVMTVLVERLEIVSTVKRVIDIIFFLALLHLKHNLHLFFFVYIGKLFTPDWIFLVSLKKYKNFIFHLHLTRIYIHGDCPCLDNR